MGRAAGGMGPSAISFADINAWTQITGNRPTTWDITVMKEIDYAYLTHVGETVKENRDRREREAKAKKGRR